MRKTFAAGITLAASLTGVAQAKPLSHSEAVSYGRAYAHVAHVMGKQAAGCKLIGPQATCHRSTDEKVRRSTDVLQRMFAPPPPAPAANETPAAAGPYSSTVHQILPSYSSTSQIGGGYGSVPGVPTSFAQCVAYRESGNGAGSSNIYGIVPGSGVDVSGMSVAQQKMAFSQMYAEHGASAWSPWDHC